MTVWFDAQFEAEDEDLTVGPFDTVSEAQQFGDAHNTATVRYVGVARRVGRQELAQLIGQTQIGPAGEGSRRGVITRWQTGATSGFLTDSEGLSWFVSRDSLPDGRQELSTGIEVTFAGMPKPKPGKRYPEAYSLRIRQ